MQAFSRQLISPVRTSWTFASKRGVTAAAGSLGDHLRFDHIQWYVNSLWIKSHTLKNFWESKLNKRFSMACREKNSTQGNTSVREAN
jgi:hypothetical protein